MTQPPNEKGSARNAALQNRNAHLDSKPAKSTPTVRQTQPNSGDGLGRFALGHLQRRFGLTPAFASVVMTLTGIGGAQ